MFYSVVFILLFLTYSLPKYSKVLSILILILVYGMRYHVGWDWYNYEYAYIAKYYKFDIGYNYLMYFFNYLKINYLIYQFIISAGLIFILFYNTKKYKLPDEVLPIILFYGSYLSFYFTFVRQVIAITIFYFALTYIKEKKIWKYYISIFTAISFHKSLVIVLPFYFILDKKFSRSKILFLMFISNIIYLFKIKLSFLIKKTIEMFNEDINNKVISYMEKSEIVPLNFGYFEKTIILFIFLIFWKRIEKKTYFNIFFNLYLLAYMLTYLLYEFSIINQRVTLIFRLSMIFLYPYLITILPITNKKVLKFILIVYSFLFLFLSFKIIKGNKEDRILYKYQTIFNVDKEIEKQKKIYINRSN